MRADRRHPLSCLLNPGSIALVGASRKRNSVGSAMLQNVIRSGFAGPLFAVNPSYQNLQGIPCFASLSELPQTADLAVLAVSNQRLEQSLTEAIESGVRAVVIFASVEMEGDPGLRRRIAARAQAAGIALCGGNGMGFVNLAGKVAAFSSDYPISRIPGGITYISQSGSLATALLFNDRRLRFNLVVSSGQELVTGAADYLDYALAQPETRVIALVLEVIRDVGGFMRALQTARDRQIPVIVLKLGRSAAGAKMALSHTGAIAGNAALHSAFFRRFGVIEVKEPGELAATALLLSTQRRAGPGGVAAILDSGGERELLVDHAADLGLRFADIAPETVERLRRHLDYGLEPINPVDGWGTGKDYEAQFEACLDALMADPDSALGLFVADLTDGLDLHDGYVAAIEAAARKTGKPLVMMSNHSAGNHQRFVERLAESGIPVLEGTEITLRALRHAFDYRDFLANPPAVAPDGHPERDHWRQILAQKQAPLGEDEGYALLRAYGIPVPRHEIADTAEQVVAAARRIGYPVVLKTASPGIMHKSDVGGVALNRRDADHLRATYEDFRHRLGPRVLVVEQAATGVELALGLLRDPDLGSFIMVAMGGVMIELLGDRQILRLPITPAEARQALLSLKLAPLLSGYRGAAPVDLDGLTATVLALARLAHDLGDLIAEMDINPIMARPEGVTALDSVVRPIGDAGCAS